MEAFWVSGLMVGMYFLGSFVTWYIILGMGGKPDDTEQRMWGKVHDAQITFYESGHGDGWEEALHAARESLTNVQQYTDEPFTYIDRSRALAAIDALEKP